MIYPRSSHGVTFQPQTLFKCLLSLYSALVVHNRSGLHSEGYIRFKEDRYSVDMINPRAQNGGRRGGGGIIPYINLLIVLHSCFCMAWVWFERGTERLLWETRQSWMSDPIGAPQPRAWHNCLIQLTKHLTNWPHASDRTVLRLLCLRRKSVHW